MSAVLLALLVLSGCLSMERPYPEKNFFLLEVHRPDGPRQLPENAQIYLQRVIVHPPYHEKNFVYRTGGFAYEIDYYNEFLVRPFEMLSDQVIQWFEQARSPLSDRVNSAEAVLKIAATEWYGDFRDPNNPRAILKIEATLSHENQTARMTYPRSIPLESRSASALVAAWNEALEEILAQLETDLAAVDWNEQS